MIKIPFELTGIKFPHDPSNMVVGYDEMSIFEKRANGWYFKEEGDFQATKNNIHNGHINSETGQLIVGLESLISDKLLDLIFCDPLEAGIKRKNNIGSQYSLVSEDIKTYEKELDFVLKTMSPPKGQKFISNNQSESLKIGDKVICAGYFGNNFFYFQLLRNSNGNGHLESADNKGFYSRGLTGAPAFVHRIEYTKRN